LGTLAIFSYFNGEYVVFSLTHNTWLGYQQGFDIIGRQNEHDLFNDIRRFS